MNRTRISKVESKHSLVKAENYQKVCFCDFCGQKFESEHFLSEHVQEHSLTTAKVIDEKKYSCSQCEFTTSSAVVLRNHELVHTYTKTCPHCDKKFFQDSHLKFHLMTHRKQENKEFVTVHVSRQNGSIWDRESKKVKYDEERFVLELEENEVAEEIKEVESSKDDEPEINSTCCEKRFEDLITLLTHVREHHAKTFSDVINFLNEEINER